MNKFTHHGPVKILHVNARKEGPDEEKELAVDLKLRATVDQAVLGCFDDQLGAALFTDIGAVRNELLGPVTFKVELSDYTLGIAGSTHHGVSLKKFAFEPKDGGLLIMSLQVSLKPSNNEVAIIAEYLADEIDVSLEPASGELFQGEQ